MSTYRVVVTDQVFPSVDIERELLREIDAELEVASGDAESVLRAAADADALLNTYFSMDSAFLGKLSRCKIVARYGIGVDNIDLDAARSAGIAVTNVPDYSVEEVAAHTLALLLDLLRKIPEGLATTAAGEWGIHRVRPIQRLSETIVGLIGYGRISRRVAAALRTFDVPLVVHDPYVDEAGRAAAGPGVTFVDDVHELLTRSDAVSVHCPLTPETRGIIGPDELVALGPDGVLVNTSRGPLVQVDALVAALHAGTIRAAALDVTDPEPPARPDELASVPNLLLTPHMAYYSEAALRESQRKATTQVIKALTGQELDYRVN